MNSGTDFAPATGLPDAREVAATAATNLGGPTSTTLKPKTGLPFAEAPTTRLTTAEAHERGREIAKERATWRRPGVARRETRCFPARLS